ncbi:phosphogluconate dehydrogenase (decarboxylating) gnd1 [Claviceps citrina]|nr:phosphogluconate dehydrogenase (decarboxylating) gnd1 [Claviceps citrina]
MTSIRAPRPLPSPAGAGVFGLGPERNRCTVSLGVSEGLGFACAADHGSFALVGFLSSLTPPAHPSWSRDSARLANLALGGAQQRRQSASHASSPTLGQVSRNADNASSADLGLIGLAVMGQNLILNMADHGFTICAFNRTVSKVDRFLENEAKGKSIVGAHTVEEFVSKLKTPRRVMLLVQAGQAVDDWIEKLLPLLEQGDIIIDGGNSHFPDSNRRTKYLAGKGLRFVGSGVSGGEEGARYGPSIMPGGSEEAWPHIKDIFQSISAKSDGEACCEWVGDEGAGHYVKMVHNGIEYGDMQLICEAYDIMKRGLGLSNKEIGDVLTKWNKGVLDSFLIEITRDIMYFNDEDGQPLVEKILDQAGQKGTGKWTAVNALDLGMPVTLIAEAVLARCLSGIKPERSQASSKLQYVSRGSGKFEGDKEQFLDDLEQALYASKIISYAQGFMLMQEAAKEYGWKLNKPSIALMWRGGCIIRSVFLKDITAAYRKSPDLPNLLFDDFFNKAIHTAQPGWRDVVAKAAELGIPTPAFSTALSWFDGYRTKDLPANLLQAQRDYFGAHTFRIKPEFANSKYPEGQDIHVNWTGRGGNVSASTYQA